VCTAWRSAQRCFGSGRGRVIERSVADGASLLVQNRRAGAYAGGEKKKKKKKNKKKKKEEEEEKKNAAGEGVCDRLVRSSCSRCHH